MKIVIFLLLHLLVISSADENCGGEEETKNNLKCKYFLTETIPENLTYNQTINSISTYDSLIDLITNSNSSIDIASFYWTLKAEDVMANASSNWTRPGEQILSSLIAASKKGIQVRIAADSGKMSSQVDLDELSQAGIEIRKLNVKKLLGNGILHTKFVIVDNSSFYLGSGNMDWRSFTQVKEMGVTIKDCPILAIDLSKIFQVYWILSSKDNLPIKSSMSPSSSPILPGKSPFLPVPDYLDTGINNLSPVEMKIGSSLSHVYISSSPKEFNPAHRTNDIDAILEIINSADKFIYIAVMDYYPMFKFAKDKEFWPIIDDALKKAMIEKGVTVKLMASKWKSTGQQMIAFLKSLNAFSTFSSRTSIKDSSRTSSNFSSGSRTSSSSKFGSKTDSGSIKTKLFIVPANEEQKKIPFARVNHNKYMVTDKTAYIGTSNWSADYFINTAGVGFIARQVNSSCYTENSLRQALQHAFERDWDSSYAFSVSHF